MQKINRGSRLCRKQLKWVAFQPFRLVIDAKWCIRCCWALVRNSFRYSSEIVFAFSLTSGSLNDHLASSVQFPPNPLWLKRFCLMMHSESDCCTEQKTSNIHTHYTLLHGSPLRSTEEKLLISRGVCVCCSSTALVAAIIQLSHTTGSLIPDRLNLSVSPQ